jgi:hypothetical protein
VQANSKLIPFHLSSREIINVIKLNPAVQSSSLGALYPVLYPNIAELAGVWVYYIKYFQMQIS